MHPFRCLLPLAVSLAACTAVPPVQAPAAVGPAEGHATSHPEPTPASDTQVAPGPASRLAPGDTGPRESHHLWVTGAGTTASTYCWIPEFRAWQVLDPVKAGLPNLPVGAWVGSKPAGEADQAWAEEVFGGMYVAKYEASHEDAVPGEPRTGSGAAAGTSGRVKSAALCPVWSNVHWDDARALARSVAPEADLMGDEDWTALAVWSAIHGVQVLGNNSGGTFRDVTDPTVRFLAQPAFPASGVALTGSGHGDAWPDGVDRTTHTGRVAGVADLNGNLEEWTADVAVGGGPGVPGTWLLRGVASGVRVPVVQGAASAITSLATSPELRRFGLPATLGGSALPTFDLDHAIHDGSTGVRAMRGGGFYDVERAGVWHMHLTRRHDFANQYFGFRFVLRYR
ncbi:MAG: hypothetical protein VKP57_07320 [Candidatus Sericytochromatia bacterium]|nr:hypothetical protein [Candidatus Sericytochromatia bacterium]